MSERYTRLFSLPENLYSAGAPVVIAAGALLKDNQTGKVLAQLKIQNISNKAIKAATVSIVPLNTVGKSLGEAVSYQYLDLNAGRDAEFGQKVPVALPDAATRAFSISVSEVIFADNTVWTASETPWESLSAPVSLEQAFDDQELITQYKIQYGENCKCIYKQEKDLWWCTCGVLNHESEPLCHRCQKEEKILSNVDLNILKESKNKRLEITRNQGIEKEKKFGNALIILGIVSVVLILLSLPQLLHPASFTEPLQWVEFLLMLLIGVWGIVSGERHKRGLKAPTVLPIVSNVVVILLCCIGYLLLIFL